PGTELGAMLAGALTIHGVRRQVSIPARIRFDHGTTHVRGDFPLNLKDYGIRGLSKLLGVLKMDEHTVVHLDLTFAEAARP
ncbi:MAG: YceI family protein, partial [Gemmatimonadales bacterium]|nr:YceI family protein [Gemmatimonadales bacterium]